MAEISGPTRCCLLGVCCDPGQRAAALATFLHSAGSEASEKDCEIIADFFLDSYQVAPLGLSEFIVSAYGPAFAE